MAAMEEPTGGQQQPEIISTCPTHWTSGWYWNGKRTSKDSRILEFHVSTFRLFKVFTIPSLRFWPCSGTHFISQRNPSNPDKIFARSLFASGHGYPLYCPDTMLELDDDFRNARGINIGDVGFLSSKNSLYFCSIFFSPRTILTTRRTPPDHSFR